LVDDDRFLKLINELDDRNSVLRLIDGPSHRPFPRQCLSLLLDVIQGPAEDQFIVAIYQRCDANFASWARLSTSSRSSLALASVRVSFNLITQGTRSPSLSFTSWICCEGPVSKVQGYHSVQTYFIVFDECTDAAQTRLEGRKRIGRFFCDV